MADSRPESIPILPWMRKPVKIDDVDKCPLKHLPLLDPRLKGALEGMGIESLFQVQVAVWQEIIGFGAFERDICVNSPTGSGKTLAYALPILQKPLVCNECETRWIDDVIVILQIKRDQT